MKVGTAMGLGFALVIVLGVVMALVAWVQLARASAEATLLVLLCHKCRIMNPSQLFL